MEDMADHIYRKAAQSELGRCTELANLAFGFDFRMLLSEGMKNRSGRVTATARPRMSARDILWCSGLKLCRACSSVKSSKDGVSFEPLNSNKAVMSPEGCEKLSMPSLFKKHGEGVGAFDTTYFEYNGQSYYVTPKNSSIWIRRSILYEKICYFCIAAAIAR